MNIDQAFSYIKQSADSERLAQAYVVVAPPREDGTDFAKRVLGLLYRGEHDAEAIENGSHPDIHWIEPQKKSRVISVDQVRDVLKIIYTTAFSGGWKVGVFVGADCMNNSAANAFLKTLEEPPQKTLFLLLTDSPQSLLPTIISRCQRVNLTGGSCDGLDDGLRASVVDIMANGANASGVVRMAKADRLVRLLKGLNEEIKDRESDVWREEHVALGMDEKEIKKSDDALSARIGSRYREARQSVMHSILLWYRDILMLVSGGDPEVVHHKQSLDLLLNLASQVSYREAMLQVERVEEMNRQLGMNMPELLVFTNGFGV